jgi:hypothetical protein
LGSVSSDELTIAAGTGITLTTSNTAPKTLTITNSSRGGFSIGLSGGTTGLSVTNSPLTANGTMTLGGVLAVSAGGTGTATPALVAGSNISITGTWPNQTIAFNGGGFVTAVNNPVAGQLAQWTSATSIQGLAVLDTAHGGTGTNNPNLIPGTGITITGTWPNQTINSTATGGSTYSNANVTAYLPTHTANVGGNYFLGNNAILTGTIKASGNPSYIRSQFATYSDLSNVSPSTWGGMFAVSTANNHSYFSNGTSWIELANKSELYSNANAAAYLPVNTANVGGYWMNANTVTVQSGIKWAPNGAPWTLPGVTSVISSTLKEPFTDSTVSDTNHINWIAIPNLSVTVTPKSINNKFHIHFDVSLAASYSSSFPSLKITRTIGGVTTDIGVGTSVASKPSVTVGPIYNYDDGTATNVYDSIQSPVSGSFMDSPATTSPVTYAVKAMFALGSVLVLNAAATAPTDYQWDPDGTTVGFPYLGTRSISTITVMEVVP